MFIGTLDAFCQKLIGDINAKYRQFDILDQNRLVLYVMSRLLKSVVVPSEMERLDLI